MSNTICNQNFKPTMDILSAFVNNELWDEFCQFIESNYSRTSQIEFSRCSMQKGWNVKYKKSGKSLCTLYPMAGFFIALVVIGEKEKAEADIFTANCSNYIRELYRNTPYSCGGRWLMIEVKESTVLNDVMKLIQIRAK